MRTAVIKKGPSRDQTRRISGFRPKDRRSITNVGVKLRLPAKNLTEFKNPFSSKGTGAPSSKPQHRKDQMNYPALFPSPYCLVKS